MSRPIEVLRTVPWREWTEEERWEAEARVDPNEPEDFREKGAQNLRCVLEGYARQDPERILTYRDAMLAHAAFIREFFSEVTWQNVCDQLVLEQVSDLDWQFWRAERAGIELDAPITREEAAA